MPNNPGSIITTTTSLSQRLNSNKFIKYTPYIVLLFLILKFRRASHFFFHKILGKTPSFYLLYLLVSSLHDSLFDSTISYQPHLIHIRSDTENKINYHLKQARLITSELIYHLREKHFFSYLYTYKNNIFFELMDMLSQKFKARDPINTLNNLKLILALLSKMKIKSAVFGYNQLDNLAASGEFNISRNTQQLLYFDSNNNYNIRDLTNTPNFIKSLQQFYQSELESEMRGGLINITILDPKLMSILMIVNKEEINDLICTSEGSLINMLNLQFPTHTDKYLLAIYYHYLEAYNAAIQIPNDLYTSITQFIKLSIGQLDGKAEDNRESILALIQQQSPYELNNSMNPDLSIICDVLNDPFKLCLSNRTNHRLIFNNIDTVRQLMLNTLNTEAEALLNVENTSTTRPLSTSP